MPSSPTTAAMKPPTVDYPSIISRPPTTIPYFKKPDGISLFYTVFSRFSDTFVFLVVALLSYKALVVAVILTKPSLGRTGRLWLLGFSAAVAYPFLFLYFNRIHRWRKTDLAKRLFFKCPGPNSKTIGSLIMVAFYCVKLWAGVYSPANALIGLLAVTVVVSMYLALRPAFDYRVVDGLFGAVMMYGFLARRDDSGDGGGSMVIPCLVALAGGLVSTFRFYFLQKAMEAENCEPEGQ